MKNNKNFGIVSNVITIACTSLLLVFLLSGMLLTGFTYRFQLGDSSVWYNYIDWKIMGFPLVVTIIAVITTGIKLFKCTIPQYKASNNKSIGILLICFDILLVAGFIIWVSALIVYPGLTSSIPATANGSSVEPARSEVFVSETTIILGCIGIGSMFVASIMSPILSKKLQAQ